VVTVGGGTNVQMAYQTSPTKDDSLFQAVTAAFNVATGATVTAMLKDTTSVSLSRWLRWQLTVTGSPSSSWDATFRILVAANVVGRGGRAKAMAAVSPTTRSAASSGPAGEASSAPSVPLHAQASGSAAGTGLMVPGPAGAAYYARQQATFSGQQRSTASFQQAVPATSSFSAAVVRR
jgi:hypothetical protein